MPKKSRARSTPTRYPTSTYRFRGDTRQQLQALRSTLRDPLGQPLSETDIVRLAIQRLAEAELGQRAGAPDTMKP